MLAADALQKLQQNFQKQKHAALTAASREMAGLHEKAIELTRGPPTIQTAGLFTLLVEGVACCVFFRMHRMKEKKRGGVIWQTHVLRFTPVFQKN
jgi:hypothetical protein